jgi:hypothetical protein
MRTGNHWKLPVSALVLLFFSPAATAGEVGVHRSLSIGAVTVVLGSPAEGALRDLSAKYKVHDIGDGDFVVMEKDRPRTIGGFKVHAGKVVRISRDWANQDTREAHALAESMWALLAEATNDSEAAARVVTRIVRRPDDTYYDIQIIFPDRRVSLMSSKSGMLGLSETIEELGK